MVESKNEEVWVGKTFKKSLKPSSLKDKLYKGLFALEMKKQINMDGVGYFPVLRKKIWMEIEISTYCPEYLTMILRVFLVLFVRVSSGEVINSLNENKQVGDEKGGRLIQ